MQKRGIVAKATATVAVLSMVVAAIPADVDAATKKPALTQTSLTMEKGDTAKLNVKKKGNKIKRITWKTTDKNVAKVSKKGLVTATGEGNAAVKAICKIKGKKKKTTLKCDVTVTDSASSLVGGWEIASDPTITPEIAGYLKKATEGLAGVNYEPYALLATQLVAGMNYRVFCKTTPVVLNPVAYYTIVDFYVDLQGKVSGFKVKGTTQGSFDALPTASGSAVSGSAASGSAIVGGYVQAESPVIDSKYLGHFANFKMQSGADCPYRPIATLGTQVVSGGFNVLVICERDGDEGKPYVGYYIVTLHHPNNGKAFFSEALPITSTASNYDVATDISETVVEKFAHGVKTAILQKKWEKLSEMIKYPIKVKSDVSIKDATEFVAFMEKSTIRESFIEAILNEDCINMFARDQGIMMGAGGQIWIGEVKGSLKIIAFNDFIA